MKSNLGFHYKCKNGCLVNYAFFNDVNNLDDKIKSVIAYTSSNRYDGSMQNNLYITNSYSPTKVSSSSFLYNMKNYKYLVIAAILSDGSLITTGFNLEDFKFKYDK